MEIKFPAVFECSTVDELMEMYAYLVDVVGVKVYFDISPKYVYDYMHRNGHEDETMIIYVRSPDSHIGNFWVRTPWINENPGDICAQNAMKATWYSYDDFFKNNTAENVFDLFENCLEV